MSHKLMIRFEIIAVASALLLSSCAKEGGNGVDATLSFSADTPELVEVKAEAVTSVSDFYTKGYAGTTQWFPDPSTSTDPVNVVIPGTATFSDYKWIYGDSKIFYAYSNNLPTSGATAAIANTGVTLTYTAIPTDAANQTDVTLGRYSGNGDNEGKAALTFYHPLAQVVFKMGDMAGVSSLDKIEIKGVYSAGTTTLNTSTTTSGTPAVADFSWTNISGSATVSQTITGALPSKDSEIGVPFMLIPQNLATQNVTISVTVTTTGGSSVTLTKKLITGTFATGNKTICTLTVNPARELGCTLAAYTADAGDDIFPTEEPEYVEMKMGSGGTYTRKWATMNLGATTVAGSYKTCYGDLYQWGSVNTLYTGFPWTSATTGSFTWKPDKSAFVDVYLEYKGYDSTLPDANDVVKHTYPGTGWRMPTNQEFKDLYDACLNDSYDTTTNPSGASTSVDKGVYWCTAYDGVAGCLFYDGTNKLFFPAAGYGHYANLNNAGSDGHYWSSTFDSPSFNSAYSLYFDSSNVNPQSGRSRYVGYTVRPVSD